MIPLTNRTYQSRLIERVINMLERRAHKIAMMGYTGLKIIFILAALICTRNINLPDSSRIFMFIIFILSLIHICMLLIINKFETLTSLMARYGPQTLHLLLTEKILDIVIVALQFISSNDSKFNYDLKMQSTFFYTVYTIIWAVDYICLILKMALIFMYIQLEWYLMKKDTTVVFEEPNEVLSDCAICMETYIQNDQIIELKCTHNFHASCLNKWFERGVVCPICKQYVDTTLRLYENEEFKL